MAHKHNRRRTRPRSRPNRQRNNSYSSTSSGGYSYDSNSSLPPQITYTAAQYYGGLHHSQYTQQYQQYYQHQHQNPLRYPSPDNASIASHWSNQLENIKEFQPRHLTSSPLPSQSSPLPSLPTATAIITKPTDEISTEAQRIRIFGGEPGDDLELCHKMLDMFEGMDFMNT